MRKAGRREKKQALDGGQRENERTEEINRVQDTAIASTFKGKKIYSRSRESLSIEAQAFTNLS